MQHATEFFDRMWKTRAIGKKIERTAIKNPEEKNALKLDFCQYLKEYLDAPMFPNCVNFIINVPKENFTSLCNNIIDQKTGNLITSQLIEEPKCYSISMPNVNVPSNVVTSWQEIAAICYIRSIIEQCSEINFENLTDEEKTIGTLLLRAKLCKEKLAVQNNTNKDKSNGIEDSALVELKRILFKHTAVNSNGSKYINDVIELALAQTVEQDIDFQEAEKIFSKWIEENGPIIFDNKQTGQIVHINNLCELGAMALEFPNGCLTREQWYQKTVGIPEYTENVVPIKKEGIYVINGDTADLSKFGMILSSVLPDIPITIKSADEFFEKWLNYEYFYNGQQIYGTKENAELEAELKKMEQDFEKIETGGPEDSVELVEEMPIISSMPPTRRNRLKEKVIALALAFVTAFSIGSAIVKNASKSSPINPTTSTTDINTTNPPTDVNEHIKPIIPIEDNEFPKPITPEENNDNFEEETSKDIYDLYDLISITNDTIYTDMYSMVNGENSKSAYFDKETEYSIIGTILSKGNQVILIDIFTPDKEQTIESLIENGYKVEGYMITVLNPNEIQSRNGTVTGFIQATSASKIPNTTPSKLR